MIRVCRRVSKGLGPCRPIGIPNGKAAQIYLAKPDQGMRRSKASVGEKRQVSMSPEEPAGLVHRTLTSAPACGIRGTWIHHEKSGMVRQKKKTSAARFGGYLAAVLALVMAVGFATEIPAVTQGGVLIHHVEWAPSLGVSLRFLLDGLSLILAILICGTGTLIFLFSVGYMGDHPHFGRFVLFMLAFMLSMLGLVLSADLISLFVFWELTSVTSWLLIGFDHDNPRARRDALQALLVTTAGGLAMLAGFVLIAITAGSYDLTRILALEGGLQSTPLYAPALILVLLGAFTKSALFPFHFWLPNAMSAPTPVSAWLHSATMVKGGVYLLARLHPAMGGTAAWQGSLTVAGLITALMASVIAMRQTDLKQVLAWTTLMAIGVITMLLAGSSGYALTAAITFLIVHALYKAALFMVVGAVDHATGTRDVALLRGLRLSMPLTALAAAMAGLSMAGLPPLIGWIGKEMIYQGAATLWPWGPIVAGLVGANALIFAVAGIVAFRPFFGTPADPPRPPHEVGWQMLCGPLILGVLGLSAGLFAPVLLQPIIGVTVTGSLGGERAAALHLWPGLDPVLVPGLATFALGALFYAAHKRIRHALQTALRHLPSFDRGWDRLLDGLRWLAGLQTRAIQTGRLSNDLAVVFLVLLVALASGLAIGRPEISATLSAPLYLWPVAACVLGGAILTVITRSRIAALGGAGTVGIGVALIFVAFGAPDVAITQLMVETLSAVLFGIALLHLPGFPAPRKRSARLGHAALALGCGSVFALLVLAVTAAPPDRRLTDYFEQFSYTVAHGRNIVNVILVDFRAFDTFGEISVVLLAAIGAFVLLARRGGKGDAR